MFGVSSVSTCVRVSSHLEKQGRGDMAGDEEIRAAMLIPVMGTQGDTVHL